MQLRAIVHWLLQSFGRLTDAFGSALLSGSRWGDAGMIHLRWSCWFLLDCFRGWTTDWLTEKPPIGGGEKVINFSRRNIWLSPTDSSINNFHSISWIDAVHFQWDWLLTSVCLLRVSVQEAVISDAYASRGFYLLLRTLRWSVLVLIQTVWFVFAGGCGMFSIWKDNKTNYQIRLRT